ncbi:hypothetical protein ACOMHN_024341 [Nucella lapillus]
MYQDAFAVPSVTTRVQSGYEGFHHKKYVISSVLFSSIITFANIVSTCDADGVVNMLNDLYHRCDACADEHGVYKLKVGFHSGPLVAGVIGHKSPVTTSTVIPSTSLRACVAPASRAGYTSPTSLSTGEQNLKVISWIPDRSPDFSPIH